MINLLPYDKKKQLHAAHMNVALLKYLVFMLFAVIFLIAACMMTFVFLQNNNIVKNGDHPLDFSSPKVTEQGEILHNNLITTGKLLNQQVKYSRVLTELDRILPKGSVINKLISAQDSTGKTKLQLEIITSANINDDTLKSAFQNSAMFSSFNIISSNKNKSSVPNYPNSVEVEMFTSSEVIL